MFRQVSLGEGVENFRHHHSQAVVPQHKTFAPYGETVSSPWLVGVVTGSKDLVLAVKDKTSLANMLTCGKRQNLSGYMGEQRKLKHEATQASSTPDTFHAEAKQLHLLNIDDTPSVKHPTRLLHMIADFGPV